MAYTGPLPQWANEDGRAKASDDDANVTVYPYVTNGEYKTNQSGVNPRATTTVTRFNGSITASITVYAAWSGVSYFWTLNQSVTVPNMIYLILNNDPDCTVT